MRTRVLAVAGIATALLLAEGVWVYALMPRPADASRNSAGTETIPNTFVTGTVISSTAVNANFSDLATEMTDSLNRSGKGGMLAAVRGTDGTVAAPAFSYTSETGSGEYRIGTGDLGWAISGAKKLELTGSLFTVTPAASFSSTITAAGLISNSVSGTGSTVLAQFLEPSLANGNLVQQCLGLGTSSNQCATVTFNSNATPANSTACLGLAGSASTLCADGNGKTTSGSLQIGASGTAISASIRASTSATPGSVSAATCGNAVSITVTGTVAGTECAPGIPSGQPAPMSFFCQTSLNTCIIVACNVSAGALTPASGTYACRVFNP